MEVYVLFPSIYMTNASVKIKIYVIYNTSIISVKPHISVSCRLQQLLLFKQINCQRINRNCQSFNFYLQNLLGYCLKRQKKCFIIQFVSFSQQI